MVGPGSMCTPEDLVAPVLRAIIGQRPDAVVLIDGPSGAGKSSLADALIDRWPAMAPDGTPLRPTLVRLDDIYPGWSGLNAAIAHLTEHVLVPRREGRLAAWQRYDWERAEPAEWHLVDPGHPLIVEGCGALAAAHVALSDVRVWLSAADALRKRRALARDGDLFRSHWDQWQRDWEAYRTREHPERGATITLMSG